MLSCVVRVVSVAVNVKPGAGLVILVACAPLRERKAIGVLAEREAAAFCRHMVESCLGVGLSAIAVHTAGHRRTPYGMGRPRGRRGLRRFPRGAAVSGGLPPFRVPTI